MCAPDGISVVGAAWGLNPRVTESRRVMGVSDWGNKDSVIKGDVDVAIDLPLRWEVYRTWVMKNKNGDVYQ